MFEDVAQWLLLVDITISATRITATRDFDAKAIHRTKY